MNSTVLKAIMALFCMVLTTACKESSENEDYSPLQLVSVTPSEGEQVTAGTVEVVFEFNQSVEIKDAAKITLNNKAVENAYAVVKYLKAKVEVEAESTNIFKIASGALLAKPSDVENEEMNITFTARAEENYNNRHFDINPVPCNPNADEPAKALYVWLLKQFGKKMIYITGKTVIILLAPLLITPLHQTPSLGIKIMERNPLPLSSGIGIRLWGVRRGLIHSTLMKQTLMQARP